MLPMPELDKKVLGLQEKYGLQVDPKANIWQLSVGEQQRVEILKMLYRGAKILIIDEPTAVLMPQEVEELFVTLRTMRSAASPSSSSATSSTRCCASPTASRSSATAGDGAGRPPRAQRRRTWRS